MLRISLYAFVLFLMSTPDTDAHKANLLQRGRGIVGSGFRALTRTAAHHTAHRAGAAASLLKSSLPVREMLAGGAGWTALKWKLGERYISHDYEEIERAKQVNEKLLKAKTELLSFNMELRVKEFERTQQWFAAIKEIFNRKEALKTEENKEKLKELEDKVRRLEMELAKDNHGDKANHMIIYKWMRTCEEDAANLLKGLGIKLKTSVDIGRSLITDAIREGESENMLDKHDSKSFTAGLDELHYLTLEPTTEMITKYQPAEVISEVTEGLVGLTLFVNEQLCFNKQELDKIVGNDFNQLTNDFKELTTELYKDLLVKKDELDLFHARYYGSLRADVGQGLSDASSSVDQALSAASSSVMNTIIITKQQLESLTTQVTDFIRNNIELMNEEEKIQYQNNLREAKACIEFAEGVVAEISRAINPGTYLTLTSEGEELLSQFPKRPTLRAVMRAEIEQNRDDDVFTPSDVEKVEAIAAEVRHVAQSHVKEFMKHVKHSVESSGVIHAQERNPEEIRDEIDVD